MTPKEALNHLLETVIRDPDKLDKFVAMWTAGLGNLSAGRYSLMNTLMILIHKEDASLVGGFNRWKEYNRYVKKGSRGIPIFAPMIRKDENDEKMLFGFKIVKVFDVSQTDGEDLPEMGCPQLIEGGTLTMDHVIECCDLPITIEQAPGSSNGWTDFTSITVRQSSNPSAMVSTALHEIGHNLCRHKARRNDISRAAAEFEAESFAYIVGTAFGIKNEKAKLYLGNWEGKSHSVDEININLVLSQAEKTINRFNEHKNLASQSLVA